MRKCFVNRYGLGIRVALAKPVKTESGKMVDSITFNQPNPEDAQHNGFFTDDKLLIKAIEALPRYNGNPDKSVAKHIFPAKTKEDVIAEALAKRQGEALEIIKSNKARGLFHVPDDKMPVKEVFALAEEIGVPTKRDGKDLVKATVLKNVVDLITN